MRASVARVMNMLVLVLAALLASAGIAQAQGRYTEDALVAQVAQATGKSRAQVRAVLATARFQPAIVAAMERPAESKPWPTYRAIFMTPARIQRGVRFYREHRALIDRISQHYGVPGSCLVAILGVETDYGRVTGSYRVLDALTTLAFHYPSRSHYFYAELRTLLELPESKLGAPLTSLKGSYAGAQGWVQFMPSSIENWAVDGDHDGRVDLDGSLPDILASVANYFVGHGWASGEPVAVPATAQADASKVPRRQPARAYPVEQFEAWGYGPERALNPSTPARLLTMAIGDGHRHWLTFPNFRVITRYNTSPMYALVVQQLSRAIAARLADTTVRTGS